MTSDRGLSAPHRLACAARPDQGGEPHLLGCDSAHGAAVGRWWQSEQGPQLGLCAGLCAGRDGQGNLGAAAAGALGLVRSGLERAWHGGHHRSSAPLGRTAEAGPAADLLQIFKYGITSGLRSSCC